MEDVRAAISNQLGRFGRLLDTKHWSELATVFTDDVLYDYGGDRVGSGLAALRDNFQRYLDRCGASQHLLGSIVIDLTDTTQPVSSSYVQARHLGKNELAGQYFDTNGDYTDMWRQNGGIWRIYHRVARFPIMVGNPAVIAFEIE